MSGRRMNETKKTTFSRNLEFRQMKDTGHILSKKKKKGEAQNCFLVGPLRLGPPLSLTLHSKGCPEEVV